MVIEKTEPSYKESMIAIAHARQMQENWVINVSWVKGKNQLAACMTKVVASTNDLLNLPEKSRLSAI